MAGLTQRREAAKKRKGISTIFAVLNDFERTLNSDTSFANLCVSATLRQEERSSMAHNKRLTE
jgi:hypothetical protein